MKKLILFELIILFLATTFESDSPPGWFQQIIPVNKPINDVFFLDSSNGWAVTALNVATDTAFVLKTTNGGTNWNVVYNLTNHFRVVQFLDLNTGYIAGGTVGGTARAYKTTDGGASWNIILSVLSGSNFRDVFFVNKDTGWVGDDNTSGGAGLRKTTDGGMSWTQQLSGSFGPKCLYFLNKDTGWAGCQSTNLYRTTNGGAVWSFQYTFPQQINDVHFFNINVGVVSSGFNHRTTDGGSNWVQTNLGGIELSAGSDSIIWAGTNAFQRIRKSSDGGITWFNQTSPINNNSYTSATDSQKAWAGFSGIVHTTDGGGPPVGIQQISSEVPTDYKLFQNYPNPFNPTTNIKYQIVNNSHVKLIIFDITGKQITELVNQKQNAGTYEADWNASGYSSGIYFYSLVIEGKAIETKKMLLIK